MIDIISHRGYWHTKDEHNSQTALRRALEQGFGIETDVRDHLGQLCIAHDVPGDHPLPFEALLRDYTQLESTAPLLINIKADGLGPLLQHALDAHGIKHYKVFDMSIPETVRIARSGQLGYLSRISDVEPTPLLIEQANGLWIDSFDGDYPTPEQWHPHLKKGDWICFVSPELHGRELGTFWQDLKTWQAEGFLDHVRTMLCTDWPSKAATFFKENQTCNAIN